MQSQGSAADVRGTRLANGFYLLRDYASGLRGCYNADGSQRHGDLRLSQPTAAAIIAQVSR